MAKKRQSEDIGAASFDFSLTYAEQREASFDVAATASLIKAIKLSKEDVRSLKSIAESNRRYSPRIADFRQLFPDFPLYIVVDRQSNLRDSAGLSNIFPASQLSKLPFIRDYFEAKKALQVELAGRPLVVLMQWPRMSEAVALHQIPPDEDLPGVRIRLIYDTKPVQRLSLEPVSQLRPILQGFLNEV